MNTYIAFLRATNAGGYRKVKMQDLRDMFEKMIDNASVSLVPSGDLSETKNSFSFRGSAVGFHRYESKSRE